MEKTIPAFEARRNFGALIEDVSARGDKVIVERHGKPVAAVVPLKVYDEWKANRDRLFDLIEQAARNANLTEEEAAPLVEEAIAWARATKAKK